MTEYVALVVVILGLMIYLLHLAFSLSDNYDPLKMLLIGVSMMFGILLLALGQNISVDQGASSAIQGNLDIGYSVWITLTIITWIYITIFLIVRAWNAINKKNKLKLYDEENK